MRRQPNFRLMTLFLALFVPVLAQGYLPKMTAAVLNRGAKALSSAALGDYGGMARTKATPAASAGAYGAAPVNHNPSNSMACPTISIANPATASGTVFSPFSQSFTQTQGVAPITFSLNSGTLPTGLTLAADGTLSGTPTQVGSFPITVKATDANNCVGTGAAYTLEIGKATPVITIENAADLIDGQSYPGVFYTVLASLSASVPGAPSPSGLLLFSNGELEEYGFPSLPMSLWSLTRGVKTITVTFGGDSYYLPGSASVSHTVLGIPTAVIINSSSPSSNTRVGEKITLYYTLDNLIDPDDGTIGPLGGQLYVSDGPGAYYVVPATSGFITFPLNVPGIRTLRVAFTGDPSREPSYTEITRTVTGPLGCNASFSPDVVPAGGVSTLTLAITNLNPNVQESASLTHTFPANLVLANPLLASTTCGANLTAPQGGALQAGDSTFVLGNFSLPQNGSCTVTFNVTPLAAGYFRVIFSRFNSYSDGTSITTFANLSATPAQSTTLSGITHSPEPSVTGQSYTVGFTLNAASGTPTGTVTVTDGTGGACSATLPATSCALTSTSSGAKTLTITYSGDANFAGSTTTATHQVNKANTTTAITAATPDPSVFGQSYAVTAGVAVNSPGGGTPTGTVTVTDGTNNCTITLPATNCTLPGTAVGAKTLTATYNGDAHFNASPASAGVSHTVNKADATISLVSDNPDSSAVGQNVTVVFTAVATAPGAGAPTGNVTVSDGVNSCTGTVAAGSCVMALTTPGNRTLTATYAGDANFNGGSDTESHTVVAPPSITKAFAPASAQVNTTTTLIFTITNPASNTVALTGVGFTDSFPGAGNLVVATPLTMTNTCGGTLTNAAGGVLAANATGIKLSGGSVNANSTCTVSVTVTPKAPGPFVNVTGNVSSTNGGAGNTATATLATDTPPAISSNTLTVKAGSNPANFTIGTAIDPDQAAGTLGFTINGNPATASSNGVTVSNVKLNANGSVTADVAATCAATNATFNLVVTDNQNATGTGTLTVTVAPNTPPVLSYNATTITAGTTPTIPPATGPSDNGTITSLLLQSVSPNNGGLQVGVNGATGQVQVTGATLTGSYTVVVGLTDNCGVSSIATVTINVVCPTVSLNPANLPSGTVNTVYNQMVSATPAGTAYSFVVSSGALPNGLTLNASTGAITGSPTVDGAFNFRVTVTGFGGCTAFRDYQILVTCPAVTLTPAVLPGGAIGTPYNQTVSGSPAGAYSYAVTSGALPLGLSLNATSGAITGTPTASGSYTLTITASTGGGSGCAGSRNYTLAIGCSTITLAALGNATAGTSYTSSVAASPGGSYTYSLVTGSLPSGLMLNPTTGAVTGLPGVNGTYSFTIKAQTAAGCSATQQYSLVVGCPNITLSAISAMNLNSPYSQAVTASPSGSYSFAVTAGALPAGVFLNAATGMISGTATAAGDYNFTITATGFGGCTGSRNYTGTISGGSCPSITLANLPNGSPGQLYTSAVTASPTGNYSYNVTAGSLPPGLTLYGSVGLIYGHPTAAGSYGFTVTATDNSNCTGSKQYNLTIGGAAARSLVFGDFDGDGKADLSVWRSQAGEWLTVASGNGKLKTEAWGTSAAPYFDVMVPEDYDGDGKMDLAVFRKSTGEWLIKSSQDGAVAAKVWGQGIDLPVPGDYDGDGKTDIAVWRGAETNWYILRSSDGQSQTISWGTSRAPYRDVPVPADYDGDGKTDVAVFRRQNGHWYIRLSSDGTTLDKAWGLGTDVPVASDYDGDGKADIAVWRGAETNWYILRSSDGSVQTISWGTSSLGDVPVPGDFDGDGKADVAVWRATEGNWYAKLSGDNSELTRLHGQADDTPVSRKPQL